MYKLVKIVDRSNNYKKRMILEMTHIASNSHTVNQKTDIDNLSAFYFPLLNKKNLVFTQIFHSFRKICKTVTKFYRNLSFLLNLS